MCFGCEEMRERIREAKLADANAVAAKTAKANGRHVAAEAAAAARAKFEIGTLMNGDELRTRHAESGQEHEREGVSEKAREK